MILSWHQRTAAVLLAVALSAGCRSGVNRAPAPLGSRRPGELPRSGWGAGRTPAPVGFRQAADFAAAQSRSSESKKPMVLLMVETGKRHAEQDAYDALNSGEVRSRLEPVETFVLDIGPSQNRALAARYHVLETPVLLCLSPQGIIVSRDEKQITNDVILGRLDEVGQRAPGLDATLASLEETADGNKSNAAAQVELTSFLLAHQNAFEAIPTLAAVAHSESVGVGLRTRAWVALARAYLWIAESEKGRHEARDLILKLGFRTREARAGGALILGLDDAAAKRTDLARREFEEAFAAAPDSSYGKEADAALAAMVTGTQP